MSEKDWAMLRTMQMEQQQQWGGWGGAPPMNSERDNELSTSDKQLIWDVEKEAGSEQPDLLGNENNNAGGKRKRKSRM